MLVCQENIKNQSRINTINYNQLPHLTQDTIWESDKNTRKHQIQESQEVSQAAKNRQDSLTRNTNNKKDPQKKNRHGTVSKEITQLEGLNLFGSTNLTLISDVDNIW